MRRHPRVWPSRWIALSIALGAFSLTIAVGGGGVSVAGAACVNEAVRLQQGSTDLPECRAYEMVSPADKNFSSVYWKPSGTQAGSYAAEFGVVAAARDGSAVVYPSFGVFAGGENALIPTYRSRRGPEGWTTKQGAPPIAVEDPNAAYCPCYPFWKSASSNLGTGLITTSNPWSPLDHNTGGLGENFNTKQYDHYLRMPDDSTELASAGPTGEAVGNVGGEGGAAVLSRDGSGLLFATTTKVVPQDAGRAEGLSDVYLHREGRTIAVNQRPDGNKVNECGSAIPPAEPIDSALSADGRTALFVTPEPGFFPPEGVPDCNLVKQLYVRTADGEILDVSASKRTPSDPAGTQEPTLVRASVDGQTILFRSEQMLTNDTPDIGETHSFLYEYRVADRTLHYLTTLSYRQAAAGGEREKALTQVITYVSPDASHVYLTSTADLASGAINGLSNLYVLSGGVTRLIATGNEDISDSNERNYLGSTAGGPSAFVSTDDGSALLFVTKSEVEGFNSTTGHRDSVFLYREGRGLQCIYCTSESAADQPRVAMGYASAAKTSPGLFASSLSGDGSMVAFETGDALLPGDRDNRRDVYLWNEGNLSLLTPSPAESNAYLMGMSTSGRDVFIATTSALVGADVDGGDSDVYDIRVDGGFLEQQQPRAVACSGEACQPPAAAAPSAPAVASEALSSRGKQKSQKKPTRCVGPKKVTAKKKSAARRKSGGCHGGKPPKKARNNQHGGAK